MNTKKEIDLIDYTNMQDTMLIMNSLKTIRGFKLPLTEERNKQYFNEIRQVLAKNQHEKCQSIESFDILQNCNILSFK